VSIPTLDAEIKLYICDLADFGLSAPEICEKLHREGDSWVDATDVVSVVDDMNDFRQGAGRWALN
jgi:hypothetical protein